MTRHSSKKRKGRLLNVWVSEDQKRRLDHVAATTLVNRSEIVRKALEVLFEQVDRGQLSLGFPEISSNLDRRDA